MTKSNDSLSRFYFDDDAAQLAIDFFTECLTHTTGDLAGQPFTLEPWQQDVVGAIFGWKRKADGLRKYREVFIALPRKNGKTTLASGLALYALYCDGEKGGQVINAAADREQAALCFDAAKLMAENEQALFEQSNIFRRSIVVPRTASVYKVISSDAATKHGLNCSYIGADELHAWRGRELWDVLQTSRGARKQPLTVVTTTAGYDRHSICFELWEYARKVRDGIIQDDTFLPVLFEAEEGDDWTQPDTWAKANPNLGVSVGYEFLEQECKKAKELPRYENTFRQLYLNQWTEQAVKWLSLESWDKCKLNDFPDLSGQQCYAGLDLASTGDITALVLAFPIDGKVYIKPYFFLPQAAIEKRGRRDSVPYEYWTKSNYIEVTDGNVLDYDYVRKRINDLGQEYEILEIAIDRWNATQISTQLAGDGFNMIGFGQGFASMSAPSKDLERMILGQQLQHDGNPVLRWMASNATIEQDAAGNIKPAKNKSNEKIDGIVATINALGRLNVHLGESQYHNLEEFTFI